MDSTGDIHVVKKTKTSKSLVDTVSCPIKAIPSKNSNRPVDPPEDIDVMALLAIMEPATEKLSSNGPQIPLNSHPSNKMRVLLDTSSNGDLFFHEKGNPKPFPYLSRQVQKSWHLTNGTMHMHGRGKLRIKCLDYSASREYLVQPDIVEYDGTTMIASQGLISFSVTIP